MVVLLRYVDQVGDVIAYNVPHFGKEFGEYSVLSFCLEFW